MGKISPLIKIFLIIIDINLEFALSDPLYFYFN